MSKTLIWFFLLFAYTPYLFGQDAKVEIKRARLADMYLTVAAIESGEEVFFAEHGFYAAKDGEQGSYDLCPTDRSDCRDNFNTVLGVNIVQSSLFSYEVAGSPARLSVRLISAPQEGVLCYRFLEGPRKGRWFLNAKHSWAPAFSAQGVETYTP